MLAKETQRGGGGSGRFHRTSKPVRAIRRMVRSAWVLVKEHRRAYLLLNLGYYGLMVAAMIYVAFDPELQRTLLDEVGEAFGTGPLEALAGAYSGGQILLAAALTFAVNLVLGSVVCIALSSLIVPFSGLLTGAYRTLLWGLLFSPSAVLGVGILFHLPTTYTLWSRERPAEAPRGGGGS